MLLCSRSVGSAGLARRSFRIARIRQSAAASSLVVLLNNNAEVAADFCNPCANSTRVGGPRNGLRVLFTTHGAARPAGTPRFVTEQVRARDHPATSTHDVRGGREARAPSSVMTRLAPQQSAGYAT